MTTYSTNLRLTYQATGENSSTWGDVANTGVFQLIEDAVAGVTAISTTGGTTTLTTANGSTDQARKAILSVTGVLVSNATIVIPNLSKVYVVKNATTGAFTLTVATATPSSSAVVTQSSVAWVLCDGNLNAVLISAPPPVSSSLVAMQIFSTAGAFTYTRTAGANAIVVEAIGGGAAGGGAVSTTAGNASFGSGGGGGCYTRNYISAPSASYSIVVGAGGTGVSGAAGNDGVDTSFGGIIIARGGAGGLTMTSGSSVATVAGGLGGNGAGAGFQAIGQDAAGSYRLSGTTGWSGAGGSAGAYGHGAPSLFGIASSSSNGTAASIAGGGGSGAFTAGIGSNKTGGAGARGLIVVWEFA